MSRTTINFILDSCLFVTFTTVVWVSALLQFIFPPATRAAGVTLWGRDYDAWHRLQSACLGVLMFSVLLHLILHWTWICGFVSARLSKWTGRKITTNEATRTIYGVSLLATVLLTMGSLLTVAQIMLQGAPSK